MATATALGLLSFSQTVGAQQQELQPEQQQQAEEAQTETHSGTVVSVEGRQLTMTAEGETEPHTHRVPEDATILVDGQAANLEDLQAGDRIQVTTRQGEPEVALEIRKAATEPLEAEQPQLEQPAAPPEAEQPPLQEEGAAEQPQAELGVLVTPTPGAGVFIHDVDPQGAAAQAGLRAGDYLLAINGQNVQSPDDLIQGISQKQAGEQVQLTIWRQGQQTELQATLQPRQPAAPGAERRQALRLDPGQQQLQPQQPWLGVVLHEDEEVDEGVRVTQLYPGGPAERAGLRGGDVIIRIGDQEITSPEQVREAIGQHEAGEEVSIVVMREGEEHTLEARLASRGEFFGRQFRPGFEGEFPSPEMMMQQHPQFRQQQQIHQMLQQLHQEVQMLRQEVQQLRGEPGIAPPGAEQPPVGPGAEPGAALEAEQPSPPGTAGEAETPQTIPEQ